MLFGDGGRTEVCVGVQQDNVVFASKTLADFSAIPANPAVFHNPVFPLPTLVSRKWGVTVLKFK